MRSRRSRLGFELAAMRFRMIGFSSKRGPIGETMAELLKLVRVVRDWAAASMLLAMLAILGIAGCGGSSNPTNVSSITVSPSSASVNINDQIDFTASVTLVNNTITTNTSVTWQVNGTTGGNTTIGTITSSTTDVDVGVYTAPATVPTTTTNGVTTNGQVIVTAIISQSSTSTSSTSTSSTTITSNSVIVTIGAGTGIAVTPTTATVPAGGTFQFVATNNSVTDTNARWTISSTSGGDIGSINTITGLYTAPDAPPAGGQVTVTATDPTLQTSSGTPPTATATAVIVFSDASLSGPLAFSYTGNDSNGFRAVTGRFVTDGAGTIVSGVEDIDSYSTHVTSAVPIQGGNYKVGSDGRTSAMVTTSHGTETWQFVLTSTQHALMIRFDTSTTGSGAIDQQNVDALTPSVTLLSGPYVFLASGGDAQFNPMGIAGRFSADGTGGISSSGSVIDQNDNGTATSTPLSGGSYSPDGVNVSTGRGLITLGSLQFAFYAVDFDTTSQRITHMRIIETDQTNYLAGDIYAEPAASSYATATFPAAAFAFTAGGNTSAGAYASGGVFAADGNGNITSGAFDTDNAGTATANTTLGASTYSVDPATGRIDLKLSPSGGSSLEFASYETTVGTVLMLEIDPAAIASGAAYVQQGTPGALSGNFALGLSGQGIFHAKPLSYQSDAEGQAAISAGGITAGNLDIDTFGAVYPGDTISTTATTSTSVFGAPGTNGRGTATLVPTSPPATYSLVFYWVNPSIALVVGQDKTRVLTGLIALQY
jgi:hypothetical protein